MKKQYSVPVVEITYVAIETSFLESFYGQSSTDLTIVDKTSESDWEF